MKWTIALPIILFISFPFYAETYHTSMKIPPHEIFESMLNHAEENELNKIYKSFPFLKELFGQIEIHFKIDFNKKLTDAITNRRQITVISLIRQLIFSAPPIAKLRLDLPPLRLQQGMQD